MDNKSRISIKRVTFVLILMGLFFLGSLVVNVNNPQEVITEKVCYPATYSVSNNEVIEIEKSRCEVLDR